MKQISHSEITTYLECQRKWDLIYNQGLKQDNYHFQFGSMGHKVLETGVIPDEMLYPELKEAFGIKSWKNYFEPIIKEINEFFSSYEVVYRERKVEDEYLKGVIDLVLKKDDRYMICDYKFSLNDKDVVDINIDEQMFIYAYLLSCNENIPIENIDICYVNIPKSEYDEPRVLKNGQLSKDKAQKTTYEKYLKSINELGLNENDYEDILCELKNKHIVNFVTTSIDIEMLSKILANIDNVIKDMNKGYVLEKQSYTCSKCPFLEYCKYGKQIKKEN